MFTVKEIGDAILDGDLSNIEAIIKRALDKHSPDEIINNGIIKGMSAVGEKFKNGEYFLPEVMISAETVHKAFDILKPMLENCDYESKGGVVFGTVKGDLHDIGKNFVAMMLVGAGFEVIDLGIDVPAERFADAIVEHNPKLLCMSSLLTTTMHEMKEVITWLEEKKLRDKVKVMVGGAPVTEEYAREISADGYASNAAEAVERANELAK